MNIDLPFAVVIVGGIAWTVLLIAQGWDRAADRRDARRRNHAHKR